MQNAIKLLRPKKLKHQSLQSWHKISDKTGDWTMDHAGNCSGRRVLCSCFITKPPRQAYKTTPISLCFLHWLQLCFWEQQNRKKVQCQFSKKSPSKYNQLSQIPRWTMPQNFTKTYLQVLSRKNSDKQTEKDEKPRKCAFGKGRRKLVWWIK